MSNPSLCSDRHGEGPTPFDLPVPNALKAQWLRFESRRHFLGQGGKALASAGIASVVGRSLLGAPARAAEHAAAGASTPGAGSLGAPHFAPKAKRVIQLFMAGGPPQMDLFDHKPGLAQWNGKDLPEEIRKTSMPTGMTSGQANFPVRASPWKFSRHGECGRFVSDLLPHTAKLSDDMAVIHTMNTDAINHEPAILMANTGNMIPGKPAMGAWLAYGLGSMNDNLPSFVVLTTNNTVGNTQPITPRLWGSGFLSSQHAGVVLRAGDDPVLYLKDPAGLDRATRRAMLDGVEALNRRTFEEVGDPETHARIAQGELAFRMQASVPELSDLSSEPPTTWELYGEEAKKPGTFAYNCLMARRLAERGVRFTQIYKRGWDVHADLTSDIPNLCKETDRAAWALVTDLKRRGLLDDTLVVWGGEFGRTVYSQGGNGRDHHAKCYAMWLAGGGVKGGTAYGKTNDFSFGIDEDPVHVRDLSATVLHLLGIHHEKLTYRFQGLDQRLTGVIPAHVVHGILA